ncbi:hypothetical protein ACMY0K_13075 [Bacteroides sp. KG121]|uniref:hypothetical protein n=1 Tax=Bacteroides sp. KG121 TaxID=3397826 RepID=UPI003D99CDEF
MESLLVSFKQWIAMKLHARGFVLCSAPQLLKRASKRGVNLSEIDWRGGLAANKNNSTGFFIGPMAELTIPVIGVGIDAALMYSQRGNKYDVSAKAFSGSVDEQAAASIEIPCQPEIHGSVVWAVPREGI